ncbi:hypothetical protein BUALT_Bualt01G0090500 [Buddleja alternifolia]|uniref:RRM domain-containing protein n=1 Tax=Buddleja alternifolia TaxID=168488 RepID=A0AAV6Y5N4_9LAMI|nr:hypothetical protein BUALT_Bualt01G0090500 [Buddleja alternifolia]
MSIRTVKVSNVSLNASEQDIKEFFSFSGVIEYVEMKSDNERSQTAFITFKDPQGAETSVLLSGATIVDQSVIIALEPDYVLPSASASENNNLNGAASAAQKAVDVVSSMLAKGFILGKDAVNRAKAFDEKHQFTTTATEKVATLDQKIGWSEKITTGATIVNDKVKEMDQKFQVSEKTKSAFATAEQTVGNAGSAIMKNRYVLTGASWVTGAFNSVTKAAGDVGQKTMEKVAEGSPKAATSENKATENVAEEEHARSVAEVHTSEFLEAAKVERKPPSPKAEVHSSGSPQGATIENNPTPPKA